MMRISVITPAWNAEQTLQRACDSLRSGEYAGYEHIVVDDGSTDGTRLLADRIAAADPRVKPVTVPHGGLAEALNAGVGVSQGEFLAFLDADDEYLPGHLSRHLAYMDAHPSVDILWGGLEVVTRKPEDAYVPDMLRPGEFIHAGECAAQGTFFLRRHVVEGYAFWESRELPCPDFNFFQVASQRFRAARFPEVTYRYYRDTGHSIVDRLKAGEPG